MAQERIVETTQPGGPTHTHTTVYTDRPTRGGSGWVIALVLIVALLVGGYYVLNSTSSQVSRDNAIERAADNVGSAAQQVGNAAQKAADTN